MIPYKRLVAGAIAGVCDVWVCHPMDRFKTQFQTNPKMGMMAAARGIVGKGEGVVGGVKAMYEGIWPMTLEAVFKVGTRYFAYSLFKNWYSEHYLDGDLTRALPMHASVAGGAFAGVVESYLVVIPCELMKIRHMTQKTYIPFSRVFTNIIREEGVRALYKGGFATAARQVSNHMVRFPVFYGISNWLKQGDSTKPLPTTTNLAVGAFAGTCSTLCNTPLDVIKTRAQRQGNTLNTAGIVREVVREGGIPALWSGVSMRVIRVAPGQAITFAVVEKVVEFLSKRGY